MAYEIDFSFEELPILTVNGVAAGLVNGSATISVLSGGDFSVDEIYLEGFKDHKPQSVKVQNLHGTTEGALWLMIFRELTEGSFKTSVQDAVDEWRSENRRVA